MGHGYRTTPRTRTNLPTLRALHLYWTGTGSTLVALRLLYWSALVFMLLSESLLRWPWLLVPFSASLSTILRALQLVAGHLRLPAELTDRRGMRQCISPCRFQ